MSDHWSVFALLVAAIGTLLITDCIRGFNDLCDGPCQGAEQKHKILHIDEERKVCR